MNYSIGKILIPTDFSDSANNAMNVALQMAQRQFAEIHLFHIVQLHSLVPPSELQNGYTDFTSIIIRSAMEQMEVLKTEIERNYNFKVFTTVEFGVISINTNDYIRKNEIDLVIIGTHGTSGWKEFFLGSNAMTIVKQVICPILIVPITSSKIDFTSILYPVRNMDGMIEKYDFIRPIIRRNDSYIRLLGVLEESERDMLTQFTERFKVIENMILKELSHVISDVHICKNIADKVLEVADISKADLLVINVNLDNNGSIFSTDTFTQRIVNHAKIPVFCVKPVINLVENEQDMQYLYEESNYKNHVKILPITQAETLPLQVNI